MKKKVRTVEIESYSEKEVVHLHVDSAGEREQSRAKVLALEEEKAR